jgi:hypothetical protein
MVTARPLWSGSACSRFVLLLRLSSGCGAKLAMMCRKVRGEALAQLGQRPSRASGLGVAVGLMLVACTGTTTSNMERPADVARAVSRSRSSRLVPSALRGGDRGGPRPSRRSDAGRRCPAPAIRDRDAESGAA